MQGILDRSTAPRAGILNQISLPAYDQARLSNGIVVYLLPFGTVEVVEVQAIFRAGKVFQSHTGVASYAAANMREGTKSYTSLQLAQLLDGYGAWLNHTSNEESLSFKLATVSKHLPQTLPLLKDILLNPTFPKEEFSNMKGRALQKMSVNEEKTQYLANRAFRQELFGPAHPYGGHLGREELNKLEISHLEAHHAQYVHAGNMRLTVVGRFDRQEILDLLESSFGSLTLGTPNRENSKAATASIQNSKGFHYIEKTGMQASLRLGHLGISRKHPDYYSMLVVNTLFGGFFGSRLMKNIREEKGYTYGIYSGWVPQKHSGYLTIQTDVGNEYIRPTIEEIKLEMRKLMDDGTEADELQLVKNYLLGQSVSQRETLFQIGDILRFSIVNDISFSEIDQKFDVIQHMQPEEVGKLARTYFKPEDMLEVVAGELAS